MKSSAPTEPPPRLDLTLRDLCASTDVILCDVWGVIHNGLVHDAGAVDALRNFRHRGGVVVLVTNAPVPAHRVQRRLDGLGVDRAVYQAIVSAGDVAIDAMVEAGCPPTFVIGDADGAFILEECDRRIGRAVAQVPWDAADQVLCLGLDATGPHPSDYQTLLADCRGRDLPMICANPDIVVEVGDQLEFCAGALAALYTDIGGRVLQAGKPFAPIYAKALKIAGAPDLDPARVLAIGDGMNTDLRGANRCGFPALLITTGIHREQIYGGTERLDPIKLAAVLAAEGVSAAAAAPRLRW